MVKFIYLIYKNRLYLISKKHPNSLMIQKRTPYSAKCFISASLSTLKIELPEVEVKILSPDLPLFTIKNK